MSEGSDGVNGARRWPEWPVDVGGSCRGCQPTGGALEAATRGGRCRAKSRVLWQCSGKDLESQSWPRGRQQLQVGVEKDGGHGGAQKLSYGPANVPGAVGRP